MRLRRGISLLLTAVMMFSMIQAVPASAAGAVSAESFAITPENPAVSPESPEITPEGPAEERTAVINNLQKSYQEDEDKIVLNYETTDCSYIEIYVNGTKQEEHYTENTYEYMPVTEASSYVFRMIPYNANDTAGEELSFTYTLPYKTAAITSKRNEYII